MLGVSIFFFFLKVPKALTFCIYPERVWLLRVLKVLGVEHLDFCAHLGLYAPHFVFVCGIERNASGFWKCWVCYIGL